MKVFYKKTFDPAPAVGELCAAAGLCAMIPDDATVVVKPNLVEAIAPPVTTPVDVVEALCRYLMDERAGSRVVVAEGCGAKNYDTGHVFAALGYDEMAARVGVELIDLNQEETVELQRPECRRWPVMHLPRLVMDGFLISVPVLKVHTLAGVTLSMKNMMGCAPPAHYQQGGHWKKAAFHQQVQEAVLDLNRYRGPDFVLLDAREGMCEAHLWGRKCDPPPGIIAAGGDPVGMDAFGCGLLGVDWRGIGHIRMADGELGNAAACGDATPL